MDKLIKHSEFTNFVNQIMHAAFVARKESDHSGLKAEVDFSSFDPNVSDSRSSHTTNLSDALLAFTTMDHDSLLGLGHLDIADMW